MRLKVCSASVRLTSLSCIVELVDQINISAACHQLRLLLSVLALDFKQDQVPVKKGPLGAQNTVLIVNLIVDFFW